MTTDDIIAEVTNRARNNAASVPRIPDDIVDTWIMENLAEDAPCGFDSPRTNGGYVHLPSSWDGSVTPDDARALARLLLSAADEADAKGKP